MVLTPRHSVPDVLHLVHSRTGSVFASHHNSKLPAFVSPVSRSRGSSSGCSVHSKGQAMSLCLSTSGSYQRVLHKFAHLDQCHMLLVAPLQHYQVWLPMLLTLLVDFRCEIPPLPRLLRQPKLGVFYNLPEQVDPFTWSLSSLRVQQLADAVT